MSIIKSIFFFLIITTTFNTSNLIAQQRLEIYADAQSTITGTWSSGDLYEQSNGTGADGEWVFKFDYSYNNWWAGINFNLDNWGQTPAFNLSSYDNLKIGFWSTSEKSDIALAFQDREEVYNGDDTHKGKSVVVDVTSFDTYIEKTIPISQFIDNNFDLSIISQLAISIVPDNNIGTANDEGSLIIDYIILTGSNIGSSPTVTLQQPSSDMNVSILEPIQVIATADDPDGNISEIHIYINDQLYYSSNDNGNLSFEFIPWSNGTYNIKALAVDDDGNSIYSNTTIINVSGANITPTIGQTRAATFQKGVNLAGWMEALWHIIYNTGSTYGEAGAYTKEELTTFESMGMKTIRFPVILEWFDPNHPNYNDIDIEKAYENMDNVFRWTEELGLNLILVNHHGIEVTDDNWESLQEYTINVWNNIIGRYGNYSTDKVFFELKNEPNLISSYNLRQYQQSIIKAIRTIDPDRTLIVGGANYNGAEDLYRWLPYNDKNLIYTYHNYQPFCFVNQLWDPDPTDNEPAQCPDAVSFPEDPSNPVEIEGLQYIHGLVSDWSTKNNAPIFCGEFGVNVFADLDSRCNYFEVMGDILNSSGTPWTYWDPRSSDEIGGLSGYGWFKEGIIDCNHMIDTCVYIGLGLDPGCGISSTDPLVLSNISISPNPVNNHLTIKGVKESAKINFTILDRVGIKYSNGVVESNIIDVSNLLAGFYILRIEEDGLLRNFKFIKM